MELYYRRVETVRKGRTVPARTQTVVIFLPDVRSCLPTRLEWDDLSIKYKKHLEIKKQSNNEDDSADADKKQSKSDELINDGSNIADVEMVDEAKTDQSEIINAGDIESQNNPIDSSEAKASSTTTTTMDLELTADAAAISKALLIIISNFT